MASKTPVFPIVFVLLVVVGIAAGVVASRAARSPQTPADNPYAQFRVVDFALTDQDARPADASVFDDRVTVLTFFFTSCPGPCPGMTRAMAALQDRTAGSNLRFASISVDGDHDTPERMRDYARGFGADFSRWTFLTGAPDLVRSIAAEGLSFDVSREDDKPISRPDGSRIANILHPTRMILVGPDRRVVGLYSYEDPADLDRLIADARAALP